MSNFKIGQKVVFIGGSINTVMIYPNEQTEICEITGFKTLYGIEAASLKGYEFASDGWYQWLALANLRPLSDILAEQTEELVKELECEINEEEFVVNY